MTEHPEQGAAGPGDTRMINLALQGGGTHGAFAWGVLDKLLEDGRVRIDGISATSAGAMNAVVLAHGMAEGGVDGARAALAAFWRRIAQAASVGAKIRSSSRKCRSRSPELCR